MRIYSTSSALERMTNAESDSADAMGYDALAEFETAERIKRERDEDGTYDDCAYARRRKQEEGKFEQEGE